MSEPGIPKIPTGSKIIVGIDRYEDNRWSSIHLHDCFNSVSVRPDEGVLVIAEGTGEGRIQELSIPLRNVLRFEAVEIPIGHNCISEPINPELLGSSESITDSDEPFRPVMLRVIIRGLETSFYSIYDLGATPLPILVPFLRGLPSTKFGIFERRAITSTDDCASLASRVANWVGDVNRDLEEWAILQKVNESERARQILKGIFTVSNFLLRQGVQLSRPVMAVNAFPVRPGVANRGSFVDVQPNDVFEAIKTYTLKTRRGNEAIAAVKECLEVLSEREEERVAALKEILSAREAIDTVDPIDLLQKELERDARPRHLEQLERMFARENIAIYYVEKLPFFSLLFQYETECGDRYFAVAVRSDLNQALTEFLLCHEIAHKVLHWDLLRSKESKSVMRRILSSEQEGSSTLEKEADEFAMEILFPHSYLADHEVAEATLFEGDLYSEFVAGLDATARDNISELLEHEMLRYIHDHIEKFQQIKKKARPNALTLEVSYVEEKDLELRLSKVKEEKGVCWVRLDETSSRIIEAGDDCLGLFGEDVVGKDPLELVISEEADLIRRRAEHRKEDKRDIYYLTVLKHRLRRVRVYSFPIIRDQKYIGAVAVIKPIQHETTPIQ